MNSFFFRLVVILFFSFSAFRYEASAKEASGERASCPVSISGQPGGVLEIDIRTNALLRGANLGYFVNNSLHNFSDWGSETIPSDDHLVIKLTENKPLPKAKYEIVLQILTEGQDPAVLKKIGNKGEKLMPCGGFQVFSKDGRRELGQLLTYNVGSSGDRKKIEAETYQEAQSRYEKVEEFVNQGKVMARLRNSGSLSDLGECSSRMRRLIPETDRFLEESKAKLGPAYDAILVAAANARLCVRCGSDSVEYCYLAEKELRNDSKRLAKFGIRTNRVGL